MPDVRPGTVSGKAGRAGAALVVVGALLCAASADGSRIAAGQSRPPTVVVTVDRTPLPRASRLGVGTTHMQHSVDPWGDPAAVARAKALLRAGVRYQNQHMMGFGTLNPEPAPGVYDWRSLDRRVRLMRETGAVPVLTLCCAPDWMKGGRPGTTDWTRLTDAPLPGHYDDFAELARRVALRYPDVKHYIVWNEFKGLWDEGAQNWNVAAYTSLYNEVYDALKAVDPAIRVGGPYLPVEGTGSRHLGKPAAWHTANPVTNRNRKVLRYWLEHKRGADFLVVDRGVRDAHDPNAYTAAELFGLTDWFADVVRQIRAMTTLPVWIAEHFMSSAPSGQLQAAWHVAMLRSELLGGAAVALQWEPQGTGSRNEQNLFSDTRKHDGGKPFPAFFAYRAFHRHFPPGTRLYRARASAPSVRALASARMVLLVNTRPTAVSVVIGGAHTRLPGYGVTVVPRP